MKENEYRNKSHSELSRSQIKVLLGALSWLHDDYLLNNKYDASVLRNMCLSENKYNTSFRGNMKPLPHLYDKLKQLHMISFNSFSSKDIYECSDGFTDYGDVLMEYIGFRVETNPLALYEVRFEHYWNPFPGVWQEPEFKSEKVISLLEAFQLYGTELFSQMADVEDWNVIIKSV